MGFFMFPETRRSKKHSVGALHFPMLNMGWMIDAVDRDLLEEVHIG
jgi:hypothetical protein